MLLVLVINVLSAHGQNNLCDGLFGAILPDPSRCYGFIICLVSTPAFYECPSGHIFDVNTAECQPGNRNTCELINFQQICNGIFFSARPFPGDDSLFVGCIKSQPSIMSCLDGEYFDTEFNECSDGIERTTINVPSTTPLSTTTFVPPPTNPCIGVQTGKKKYFWCCKNY